MRPGGTAREEVEMTGRRKITTGLVGGATAVRLCATLLCAVRLCATLLCAILFCATLLSAAVHAQETLAPARMGEEEAQELFAEANALYADGDYKSAAERYERILRGGFANADVQYNLANARYRSGDTGKAVLAYERALRLDRKSVV